MTHPLTPREKVARQAAEAFHNGYQTYDQCDETMRLRFDWIADAILTALASGSGDHAELAKQLRASKRDRHGIYGRVLVNPDGPNAANAIDAILAENAALRAERDALIAVDETGEPLRQAQRDRATEAERKLAEAVEWRPIETAPGPDHAMFVVRAFEVTTSSGVIYTSDPVCVWRNLDGSFARWKQEFQPTHWLPLPPAPGAEDE